jgi:hypothetical protein
MCIYVLSSVLCCPLRDFRIKTMFGSFIPPVVCGRVHACFVYVICVCLHIVVSYTYCVVICFVFLRLMLPVSLDCPFFIVPSIFSNVYRTIVTIRTKEYLLFSYLYCQD